MPSSVKLDDIIVFDAKSRRLYGNDELAFSYNGSMLQITIALEEFIKVSGVAKRTDIKKGTRKGSPKLSAWQKYIKNKRNHIKYRDGKLNLKKMGVAFRRKQRR
jgi:hypothetical protein